tara:strand:+ start:84 stop:563 length:480 start_codon:yes stop_codon:yes gene_type:complete
MVKIKHYTLEEVERQIGLFQEETNPKKEKTMGMLLIASYGKIFNITEAGVDKANELMLKYEQDNDDLTREEWFILYILVGEAMVLEGWNDAYELNSKIQKTIFKKYKPDFFYIQGLVISKLYPQNLVKLNENFFNGFKTMVGAMERYPKLKDLLLTGDI